jgi:hypothetical protein
MALPDLTELNVSDTYKGVLHTSNVIFTESNLPPVYDGLGNKSSLKLGADGNGASVSGCLSADCIDIAGFTLIDYLYPVGAVYLDTFDVNPQTRFTGTTWTKISEGKFLAGVGNGVDKNLTNQAFSAGDDVSIGEYGHTLNDDEMASHTHEGYTMARGDGGSVLPDEWPPSFIGRSVLVHENAGHTSGTITSPATRGQLSDAVFVDGGGGDQPHNNIPPYFGVYIWKRIA